MDRLTTFLQSARPGATLNTALGFFEPGSLMIALDRDPKEAPLDDMVRGLGALLHERMHWLQFVGTTTGLFSAYLSALQAGMLFEVEPGSRDLSVADLPMLDGPQTPPDSRTWWLACERTLFTVTGAPRAYFEMLETHGGNSYQLRGISEFLWKMAKQVGVEPRVDEIMDQAISAAEFPANIHVAYLQVEDSALGAAHLMEVAARANEAWKLAEYARDDEPLRYEDFFYPPYSLARDIFYSIVEKPPTAGLELAMCVLADWALNLPLPPLSPLAGDLDSGRIPGTLFPFLVKALDTDYLPTAVNYYDEGGANELVRRIYSQVRERCPVETPLEIAEAVRTFFSPMNDVVVPDSLYSTTASGIADPADSLARLKYLTKVAYDAAGLRLKNPAFFPAPYLYYGRDRKAFHAIFDQIEPPLRAVGDHRFLPSRDDTAWFTFFYGAALQHEVAHSAAFCDAELLGDRLKHFTVRPSTPSRSRS